MIGKTRLYLTSDKKEYIDYEMINAIKVRLTGNFAMNVTRTPKGDVQGVSLNELCHELNDSLTLHIEGMDYNTKIKQIKVDGNEILLYSERANKSRVFAVPAIGENMQYFSYHKYFVNSFMTRNKDASNITRELFLVYRCDKTNEYLHLEEKLAKNKLYVDSFDFNGTDLLIQFNIPEAYMPDIEKFINGKYSSISKAYISRMMQFFKGDMIYIDFIKQIINKDKKFIEQNYPDLLTSEDLDNIGDIEVYEKPNKDEENIDVK